MTNPVEGAGAGGWVGRIAQWIASRPAAPGSILSCGYCFSEKLLIFNDRRTAFGTWRTVPSLNSPIQHWPVQCCKNSITRHIPLPLGPLNKLLLFPLLRLPKGRIARIGEDVDDGIDEHRRNPDRRIDAQRRILELGGPQLLPLALV